MEPPVPAPLVTVQKPTAGHEGHECQEAQEGNEGHACMHSASEGVDHPVSDAMQFLASAFELYGSELPPTSPVPAGSSTTEGTSEDASM